MKARSLRTTVSSEGKSKPELGMAEQEFHERLEQLYAPVRWMLYGIKMGRKEYMIVESFPQLSLVFVISAIVRVLA